MSELTVAAPPAPALLPWHAETVEHMRQTWRAERFPHAVLLQGAEGLGKRTFASWLAGAVLCDRSTGGVLNRCNDCANCKLISAGTHPDFQWVAPEEGKQQISIDQVRFVCERLTRTSFRQGYKVAVIEPAHQMTTNATNSLLKTLEEPAPKSLLVLISSQPSLLLPTVRSRCQKISIGRPDARAALAWLQERGGGESAHDVLAFAGGAPLRALEYADGRFASLNAQMRDGLNGLFSGGADVTQIAAEWGKDALTDRLVWLDLWLMSLARQAIAGNAKSVTFPSEPVHLPSLSSTLNISGVYRMVDRARELKAQLSRTALQRELAVESWLIALLDLLAPTLRARTQP